MKTNAVHDFILEDEQNFKIAAAVANAWSETMQHIHLAFLDRLDQRLKKTLPRWEFGRSNTCYEDSWASYYFWKPGWDCLYGVSLQWEQHGEEVCYGVFRELNDLKKRPHFDEVLAAVQKVDSSARKRPWWEARIRMKNPASDWRLPDVFWRMRTEPFLDEVAVQLLDVARVCEPVLDKLVSKNRSGK